MSKYDELDDVRLWFAVSDRITPDWVLSDLPRASYKLLRIWEGDYELRRQNGNFKCVLYRPSEQYESCSISMPRAVCIAWLLAKDGER